MVEPTVLTIVSVCAYAAVKISVLGYAIYAYACGRGASGARGDAVAVVVAGGAGADADGVASTGAGSRGDGVVDGVGAKAKVL